MPYSAEAILTAPVVPPLGERYADRKDVRAHAMALAAQGGMEAAVDLLLELLATIRGANDALTARLHTALRALYGRKSEKVSLEQLLLAFETLQGDTPEAAKPEGTEAEATAPGGAPADPPKPPPKRPGHSRRPLPEHLPRETKVVAATAEENVCTACGAERESKGFRSTPYLEFRQASFFILDVAREQLVCTRCSEPKSEADEGKHFDGGRPGPGLVAKVIVDKTADGMPVERQSAAIARLGISLAPSTLGDWFAWGTDLLAPVGARLFARARAMAYLQADDTGLQVLDRKCKPAVKRGHLWCFVGYDADRSRTVAFQYAPTWEAEHADALLRGFSGDLQGDGYAGFAAMARARDDGLPPTLKEERRLGCGMHLRRKFEAAFQAGDARGAIALGFFRKVYAIEERLREATPEARLAARQTESIPILDELFAWIASLDPKRVIPGTHLAKAMTYARNQEQRWRRCFDNGIFFIDSGEPERQIRYVAQGRKAYLFAGSDNGAHRLATAYTLVANCRVEGINPWAYLVDVLEKLAANWPMARIDELLPREWKRARDASVSLAADSAPT